MTRRKKCSFSLCSVWILVVFFSLAGVGLVKADEKSTKRSAADIEAGKKIFQAKGCNACHTIGQGTLSGPDLKGVLERRSKSWLLSWLKDPDAAFAKKDPIAMEMLGKFFTKMPNLALSDDEIGKVLSYIDETSKESLKKEKKK
ncbi:MAG: cytochrome c [Deltaproteobacteria bacterium]|nr:cytochrome c [Deltaproteobacteria bacterium]